MPSAVTDDHKIIEVEERHPINSVAFLQDAKQIVGGGDEGVLRYWNVKDGRQAGAAACGDGVLTIAVSKDGQLIVCGTKSGLVTVWDTTTQNKVVEIKGHTYWVVAVDISPDSKTVGTASYDGAASIWDMTTGQLLVGLLQASPGAALVALKFSTSGKRVATSPYSQDSVTIRDTQNGRSIVNIPVRLSSNGNEPTVPLAWSGDDQRIFTVSHDGHIHCFDPSSGSLLSKWPIHSSSQPASIVLSNNGNFIAASADSLISFWDTSTHSQLGSVIAHTGSVQSIALSPDDGCLVSGGRTGKKVIVWDLQNVLPESHRHILPRKSAVALLHPSGPAYALWIQGDLKQAEAVITEEMTHSSQPAHYSLANRALIRARLQDWNGSLDDAQQSLKVQPSVIGYIAKAMARIGEGEFKAGLRIFDLTFMHCNLEEIAFLFLIRSIILFETGERDDAMARVHDLIDTANDKRISYAVQAHMFALRGNKTMEDGDYDSAIKLFKLPQLQSLCQTSPWLEAISLIFGWKFDGLALSIRRQLCEALHAIGRIKEAAGALLDTVSILGESLQASEAASNWIVEFTRRCVAAFESMGDAAIYSQTYNEAIEQYSVALSLNPPAAQGLYLKRSRARAIVGLWEDAINDADEAIVLDPACPWGYERRHAALHGAQRFHEAVDAFVQMFSAIEHSSDPEIRKQRSKYIPPSTTVAAIDAAIHETFKTCPFVLIDIKTGLLCDGPKRTRVFKADPSFKELVSSMTEELDENYILQVVSGYFRYVMFSHTWQGKEPSFQEVNEAKSVWVLPPSPLNDKLRKFCEMVRDDGYRWAWSDTCCINKSTAELLNHSLVSMYRWYEDSAATLALLVGVTSPSQPGDLTNSLWMTRAWTLLELLASKVIRFYDSEWTPYLNDARTNHKESPVIMQELANTLEVAPEIITSFYPGALGVREVLRLASTRAATIEEDVAYSLIGIVGSDLTPNYGEGEAALGHLLEETLTRSGEISVLSWAGKSCGFNSCFPASVSAYKQSLYMSTVVTGDKIDTRVATLRTTLSMEEAMTIYDRILRLPPVIGAHRRLHLPCIVFPIKRLYRHKDHRYSAKTSTLGDVEFQTADVLPLAEPRKLVLVHPWICGLLDRTEALGGLTYEDDSETDIDYDSDVDFQDTSLDLVTSGIGTTTPLIISAESVQSRPSSFPSPSSNGGRLMRLDDSTRALRLIVRLEQPFSALLFQQTSNGKFRRVAAEHEIIAQPCQITRSKDVQTAVLEVL